MFSTHVINLFSGIYMQITQNWSALREFQPSPPYSHVRWAFTPLAVSLGSRIRTDGLLIPNQTIYQADLYPDSVSKEFSWPTLFLTDLFERRQDQYNTDQPLLSTLPLCGMRELSIPFLVVVANLYGLVVVSYIMLCGLMTTGEPALIKHACIPSHVSYTLPETVLE